MVQENLDLVFVATSVECPFHSKLVSELDRGQRESLVLMFVPTSIGCFFHNKLVSELCCKSLNSIFIAMDVDGVCSGYVLSMCNLSCPCNFYIHLDVEHVFLLLFTLLLSDLLTHAILKLLGRTSLHLHRDLTSLSL